MDKSQIGLSGEFHTLAQLTQRGYVATLTLGNTKGVDILVTNQEINRLFKVEVKTTNLKPKKDKLFGEGVFHMWPMSIKHERIRDKNLVYCFIMLLDPGEIPLFFLVPSVEVADYVSWQHQHWLDTRSTPVKETSMRKFRIEIEDPHGYKGNWGMFRN